MFTFAATPIKFIGLLLLFAYCTVWCVYELTRKQTRDQRIGNSFHLVMAVVMLLMVPTMIWQTVVKVVPPMLMLALFAAFTGWFGWRAMVEYRANQRSAAGHFAGHTMMFAAMTWHLAAMSAKSLAMMSGGMGHGGAPMDMAAWMAAARQPGGVLWWFALIGLPFMAWLLFASGLAIRDALRPAAAAVPCGCGDDCHCGEDCDCRTSGRHTQQRLLAVAGVGGGTPALTVPEVSSGSHSCTEPRPVGSLSYRLAAVSDFAMNFGMFWMSTGLMLAILPFFSIFAI